MSFVLLVALALAAGGCAGGGDEESTSPPEPAALQVVAAASVGVPRGELVTPAPSVQLVDGSGNPFRRAGIQVSVVLGELHGSLAGASARATDAAGQASFPGLSITGPVGTYHLIFSSPGLSGARYTLELTAGPVALVRAVSVQQQYAPEWSPVKVAPRVVVNDGANNPVKGARVSFLAGTGGDRTTGDVLTGPDGQAEVGAWVLGAVGDHELSAQVDGLTTDPIVFSASALPPDGMVRIVQQPPSSVVARDVIEPAPQVQLLDAYGSPTTTQGALVTVAVSGGAGSVTGDATQASDASGKVTFPGISLTADAAGTRTLVFSSERRASAVSAPMTVGAAAVSAYAITLRYLASPTAAQAAAFERARERIAQVVTGDVGDTFISYPAIPECGNTALSEVIDDLLIWVQLRPIDGPGGILGQASPCLIRSSSKLPVVGVMQFDTADLQYLETLGVLDAVILHEMLHVVGFGIIWRDQGLLSGAGTIDPIFTGAGARAAFLGFDGGWSYGGSPVPVENTGGAGTRDAHWRESVLMNELMTGWLSEGAQPLSRTTIASLGDLGYAVDLSEAEPLGSPAFLRGDSADGGVELDLGPDVLEIPLREISEH